MSFSTEEAMKASKDYFKGDELAASVFINKYALRDLSGNLLEKTPYDMHSRLAREFARIEAKYPNPMSEEEIFGLFDRFERVVPQGSPMSAVGNPYKLQSASNCFVINSPYDSYSGIMYTDEQEAQIMKRRGGVGFDISTIRPKGLLTQNAAGTTDGIGVFMERFSNTCREVAQGGRRGALMLSIDCHHPEIRTFINIKRDLTKVTGANISIRWSDEFLAAVENNEKVQLRFPVEKDAVHQIEQWVDAKEIWDEFVDAAWTSAEPGCLFWNTAIAQTPSDIYSEEGFRSLSTNPCFAGETLIAVADGRNAVSIMQLAEEGRDVPVYSVTRGGEVSIKMGRNPRMTGSNKKLVRVMLDDGSHFDVTQDHKCMLLDGSQLEAKDLKKGMSLPRLTKALTKISSSQKEYRSVVCNIHDSKGSRKLEHTLVAKFYHKDEYDALYNGAAKDSWANGGVVVHHKDYNGLNNSPDNLQVMTWQAHQQFHAEHDTAGEKNGRYSGFTDDQVKEHVMSLTQDKGRRISTLEWQEYASTLGLPQTFSGFRKWNSVLDLARECAKDLGFDEVSDPRLHRTLRTLTEQGYIAAIVDNEIHVEKTCELCNACFWISHGHREAAFCGTECSLKYVNSNALFAQKKSAAVNKAYELRSRTLKTDQAKTYSLLKFDLGRTPKLKEWEQKCKEEKIPFRLNTKYGFKDFQELKESGENYNHKVLSVVHLDGDHVVFNITVDDNHTVGIITKPADDGSRTDSGVFLFNCGEIILSAKDSCRLITMNSSTYVIDAFGMRPYFDFELFMSDVKKAQRLMDDLVDLEIELVDKILAKIVSDPEPAHVKQIELDLWTGIRKAALDGRRTGLGVTAIGDTVAAMNIQYGSAASIELVENVYKALALGAYESSVNMAKERGAFPVFNHEKEKGHRFLEQIWAAAPSVYEEYKKYGRRNIALTTTAPTGSVSTMTQTSSGIEPVFMTHYKRRKKINPNDKDAQVDFVDTLGDRWQEFIIYHHMVKKWMDVTGKSDISQSPYHQATANEINWEAAVDLQAAAQKWICHAISKTTNLPSSATREDIDKVYRRGWKTGCKGITVYRDGCRSGVLVSADEGKAKNTDIDADGRPTKVQPTHAPRRPDSLPCDIHHVTVKGVKWVILTGLMHGSPYEIFAGAAENLVLPSKLKTGTLNKVKNGTYSLHLPSDDGELIVKNIVETFDNPESAWATRMISMSLRHGVDVEFIVTQLNKDGNITDINKVLSRVLKKYINEEAPTSAKCKDCGSKDVMYAEGCLTCKNCGGSKCG